MKEAEYISPADAAKELAVTLRTIRRWIVDGRLPATQYGPRVTRIKIADWEAFKANAQGPSAGNADARPKE